MKVERALKKGLIRLSPVLFPPRAGERPPRRILLVRVDDRLGNLILLTPALSWLRGVRPDLRIELLLSKTFASIFEADRRIDRLIVVDKERQKRLFPVFFRDLDRIGAMDYDAAIECSNRDTFSFSSALYASATRAPRRIGFGNPLAAAYLSEAVTFSEAGHAGRDPLILAAVLLGVEPPALEEWPLSLKLPEPDAAWSAALDALPGSGGRIVGLFVGGRGAKRWPLDRFVDLAARLLDAGCHPWIFRGPREPDVEQRFARLKGRGLALVPPAPIVRIGQAFERCSCVVAPDSGPMHFASALGVPTLALFQTSDAERYRPLGPRDRFIDARGGILEMERVAEETISVLGG